MRLKNLKIRKGEKKDITSLYKLIKELAIYEKSEHKLIISQDSLFNDCFKEKPSYNFIVGEFNNEILKCWEWIKSIERPEIGRELPPLISKE